MKKRLYRSPKDGILLGIGSGIGHYFDKDPVIVRIVIVIIAFLTQVWPMVILYGLLFLIIPIDPSQAKVESNQEPRDVTGSEPKSEKKEEPPVEEEKKEEPTSSDSGQKTESVPTEHMDSGQNM